MILRVLLAAFSMGKEPARLLTLLRVLRYKPQRERGEGGDASKPQPQLCHMDSGGIKPSIHHHRILYFPSAQKAHFLVASAPMEMLRRVSAPSSLSGQGRARLSSGPGTAANGEFPRLKQPQRCTGPEHRSSGTCKS